MPCSTQRIAELSTISTASIFNQVYPLQKPDYSRDVTEASGKAFVLVHLTSSLGTNVESKLLTELWRGLAAKFGDVKFCEIRADLCIEGYPERNTPTILVYKDGDIKRQIVTLRDFKGERTSFKGTLLHFKSQEITQVANVCHMLDVEDLLVDVGAVASNDFRILRSNQSVDNLESALRVGNSSRTALGVDNDDDWD